jgi:hypothetical protein
VATLPLWNVSRPIFALQTRVWSFADDRSHYLTQWLNTAMLRSCIVCSFIVFSTIGRDNWIYGCTPIICWGESCLYIFHIYLTFFLRIYILNLNSIRNRIVWGYVHPFLLLLSMSTIGGANYIHGCTTLATPFFWGRSLPLYNSSRGQNRAMARPATRGKWNYLKL